MSEPPKPRPRRWFQFSLRSLLALVALAAIPLVVWRIYVEPFQQQRHVMAQVEELGGRYSTEVGGPAWLRWVIGSKHFHGVTLVDLADCDQPERYLPLLRRLPQLRVLVIGGQAIGDHELDSFKPLPALEVLVLDSTHVTDTAISTFREHSPRMLVHSSQRRAVAALKKVTEESVVGETIIADPALAQLIDPEHFFRATAAVFMSSNVTLSDADLAHLEVLTDLEAVHINPQGRPAAITDNGMAVFSRLRKLKTLQLWNAPQLTDAAIDHVKDLPLQHLSIVRVTITDVGVTQLARIATLESLGLSGTSITDAGLEQLAKCKSLRELRIDDTGITDKGFVYLLSLPLDTLTAGRTKVTNEAFTQIAKMQSLRTLYVGRTRISDAAVAKIAELTELENLAIDGTRVTDQGLEALKKLPKLSMLSLDCKHIRAPGLAHLKDCEQLAELYLYGTGLTDDGLAEVAKLKNLRVLHIQDSLVGKEGQKHLRMLTKLERLYLGKTPTGAIRLGDPQAVGTFFDNLR